MQANGSSETGSPVFVMAQEKKHVEIRNLIGQTLERKFAVAREELKWDEEARTVELTFSSDEPIEHWFGRLILDHDPKSIRLERLRQGGPFLSDHDSSRQIGVHESVDTDGHRGHAVIRFSKRQAAQDEFQDVMDGIRRGVSVRFIVHELILESDDENGPLYRATLWEPLENSLVAIPADISIGVGRSLACGSGEEQAQPDDSQNNLNALVEEARTNHARSIAAPDAMTLPPTTETTEARTQIVEDEILKLGEMLGDVELARDFIAEGKTLEEFRAAAHAKRKAARDANQTPTEDPKTTAARSGAERVAIARHGKLRNFTGARAAENAYRFGQFMRAALMSNPQAVEFCRAQGIAIQRAHSESDNESGGVLVPHEFEPVMIDLREQFGVFRRNANVVPMKSDSKSRPRRKKGLTAYPIGAKGGSRTIGESKKGWDLVELFARKWGVLAKYESELDEDAVISIGDDLAGEIAYAFAVTEDQCGFNGDGTGEYHGIVGAVSKLKGLSGTVGNIAGLVVGSGNAWDELTRTDFLKLIGRLPEYADTPNAKFFCSKTFYSEVMVRIILEAGGVTAAEVEGARVKMFMGYPVETAQAMPKSEANSQVPVLFGDLAKAAMFGDRRGMTVALSDSNDTDFEEDLMSIRGTERFDINVHDVGNADATAAKREPGPIVGLITAAA